jgi:hypothetical protein
MLAYPAAVTATTGSATSLGPSSFQVPITRPSRLHKVEVEFMSTLPRSFNIQAFGGNGEEIYTSPLILSGPIPKKRVFLMPRNTDFAIYSGAEVLVRANHSTNPSIYFTFNIWMEHKFVPALVFF